MITTLVLSGGGIRGISFIGALKYLKEQHIIDNLDTFIGTSIGALICSLIAFDISINRLESLLKKIDFSKLVSFNIDNLLEKYGLTEGEGLSALFKITLSKNGWDPNITFIYFYNKTKKKLL